MKSLLLPFFLIAGLLAAQQPQPPASQPQQQDKEKKAASPPVTPAARLAAAKTAFLKKSGAADSIAFDVVNDALQGWGRFQLVDAPEKAEIIIEVFTTGDSPPTVSSSTSPARRGGGMDRSTTSTREIHISQIKLSVYDAKSKMGLWSGTAHPRGAMKKIDRENNEVEAAQQLLEKLHDAVEPPAKNAN